MSQLAHNNLQAAGEHPIGVVWMDGERSSSQPQLKAEWQGAYRIIKRVGEWVNYMVQMYNHKKKNWLLHVNMLWKWQVHEPTDTGYWCEEVLENSEDYLPGWSGNDDSTSTGAFLYRRMVIILGTPQNSTAQDKKQSI